MKGGEESNMSSNTNTNKNGKNEVKKVTKPPFRPAKDDTKPLLQDPILRSHPIETEEALLRLPPFPIFLSETGFQDTASLPLWDSEEPKPQTAFINTYR